MTAGDQPTEGGRPPETEAAPRPGGRSDDTSGLSNWLEEGGHLEPGDLSAIEEVRAATGYGGGAGAQADEAESAADLVAEQLAEELAERTVDLQRLQAEYLNYKRRVERDRDLVRENATFAVLSSLLPVLDDIDRAREHGELEGGFKAVAESLERVVSGLGLTKYGAEGDAFDPNLHEALMHGHSAEVATTSVEHVAQAGYRIGERVVRAAKVTVLDPEQ